MKLSFIPTLMGRLQNLERGVAWYHSHLVTTVLAVVWKLTKEEQKWRQGTESRPILLSKKERMVVWMGGVTGGVGENCGVWWQFEGKLCNLLMDWMNSEGEWGESEQSLFFSSLFVYILSFAFVCLPTAIR